MIVGFDFLIFFTLVFPSYTLHPLFVLGLLGSRSATPPRSILFGTTVTAVRIMLAAPLHPASSFSPLKPGEEIQLKPAKDLEAFNALLPPPIEFVEGSSTGSMFDESKYTPINASPRSKNEVKFHSLAVRATLVPSCIYTFL